MKKGVVSIIVPVYKTKEAVLRECIESILNQTYRELEILLIDDGSPDQCGEICDEYAGRDERVKVIHQENSGVSSARNHGLEAADGEFITFADADDIVRKKAVETAVSALKKEDADCAIFSWIEEKEKKEDNIRQRIVPHKQVVDPRKISRTIVLDDFKLGGGYPWNKVWRSSAIKNADGSGTIKFDTSLYAYEDKLWILEILKHVNKVVLLPDILYLYRYNPNGLSKDGDLWEYRILNTFDAYKKIIDCVSYDKQSRDQGRVFITNFAMRIIWSAWVYRRFNMGYFQRVKAKYYAQKENMGLVYARGVRNAVKYILLKFVFWMY